MLFSTTANQDIHQVDSIMCSNLIAFALLSSFPTSLSSTQLVEKCETIRKELILNYQMGFNCSSITSLNLELLKGPLNLLKDQLVIQRDHSGRDRNIKKCKNQDDEMEISIKNNMEALLELHRSAKSVHHAFFMQSVIGNLNINLHR